MMLLKSLYDNPVGLCGYNERIDRRFHLICLIDLARSEEYDANE